MNDTNATTNTRPNAWGRWGPDDEAGALNLIGPAQVKRAAGLVRTGEVLRLAQPLSHKTPVPRHRSGLQHFMGRDGGDYAAGAKRPGGFQFAEDTVVKPLHIGTHIDALCHAWCEEKMFNGYRETPMRSTSGATRLGVEKMPPAFTRGVPDNFAVEVLPFAAGTVFPVHQCVIRDFGIPLLEGLMLEPLAKTGRADFLFVAAALPIVGATGSPLTPLAIL